MIREKQAICTGVGSTHPIAHPWCTIQILLHIITSSEHPFLCFCICSAANDLHLRLSHGCLWTLILPFWNPKENKTCLQYLIPTFQKGAYCWRVTSAYTWASLLCLKKKGQLYGIVIFQSFFQDELKTSLEMAPLLGSFSFQFCFSTTWLVSTGNISLINHLHELLAQDPISEESNLDN